MTGPAASAPVSKAKIILSIPQRQCLEGVSNRKPQAPNDAARDELVAIGLVAAKTTGGAGAKGAGKAGAGWALTPMGKKVLASQSNQRNFGGFRV